MHSYSGTFLETNDINYCKTCMEEILKCLKHVPKKYEYVYVDASDEISIETLYNNYKPNGRSLPVLFAEDDKHSTKLINVNGIEYYLSEWEKFHEYKIYKKVRWDIIKNMSEDGNHTSRTIKTLFKPNKSNIPLKPLNIQFKPMTGPVGLAHALRNSYQEKENE